MSDLLKRSCFTCALLAIAGCATWRAPAETGEADLRARAVTASMQEVRLSAAVLSVPDSERMFGAHIQKTGVQPVWVEVENGTQQPLWLLRPGVDPDYFSPLEVAWSQHAMFGGDTNDEIDDHFDRLGFRNPVWPGDTRSGVLFTNPSRNLKLLNVDLLGKQKLVPFTLFLPIPGGDNRIQAAQSAWQNAEGSVPDYKDLASFRSALEALPCCGTGAQVATGGDPLNVVLVGSVADVGAALVRRSYRNDVRAGDDAQQAFGRAPFTVLRKHAQVGTPATWIRLWAAPMRYNGQAVLIGQVGRPVGGRFGREDATDPVLHPNVDEARNLLIQDLMYSGGLQKFGFAMGSGKDGARYRTDGLRAALFFATRPLGLGDVELIDWVPYLEQPEQKAASSETEGDAQPYD